MMLQNSPLDHDGRTIEEATITLMRRTPALAPMIMTACCRSYVMSAPLGAYTTVTNIQTPHGSVANIPKLAVLCECAIASFFQHSNSWPILQASLIVPELSEADFLEFCVRQSFVLTLCTFLYVLQKIAYWIGLIGLIDWIGLDLQTTKVECIGTTGNVHIAGTTSVVPHGYQVVH
jgi:hypothetical protein